MVGPLVPRADEKRQNEENGASYRGRDCDGAYEGSRYGEVGVVAGKVLGKCGGAEKNAANDKGRNWRIL